MYFNIYIIVIRKHEDVTFLFEYIFVLFIIIIECIDIVLTFVVSNIFPACFLIADKIRSGNTIHGFY